MIRDVAEHEFEQLVVERSRELPVVVDFWAEWCGPCRQLGPALESAVRARGGAVELAKVDVDANQGLARAFGVQGIPAVKAFRDAKVAAEFTGAIPPAQIEEFLERLLPSRADELATAGDEVSLREALELEPGHLGAARALARALIGRGALEEALELLEPRAETDFVLAGLAARAELMSSLADEGLERLRSALAACEAGDRASGLDRLQDLLAAEDDEQRREQLRRVVVGVLSELDPADPLGRSHRRRLSLALA